MRGRTEVGGARIFACLYSPPAQRQLLEALCALEREIGASLAPGLDHQVAHTRLSWWREECQRCAAGAAAHPLTRQIAQLTSAPARAGLTGFADAATWDLAAATFESRRELTAYCERWSAAMIATWTQTAQPAADGAQLRTVGRLLRESELLLQLPADARAGRVRLPLDELERAGLTPQALTAGTPGEPLRALLSGAHARARVALAQAAAALTPLEQPPLRALVVWAHMALIGSRRFSDALPRAAGAGEGPAPLDGWRAWRAARRAATGSLRL
jgi:phytoene synthase